MLDQHRTIYRQIFRSLAAIVLLTMSIGTVLFYKHWTGVTLLVGIGCLLSLLVLSKRVAKNVADKIVRPIEEMQLRTLTEMQQRIQETGERQKELEIVLNSMVEGFLAVNQNETIFKFNAAACRMLDLDPVETFGREVRACIRNPEFHIFLEQVLETGEVQKLSLAFRSAQGTDRELDVTGSAIVDDDERSIGALFVIDDVTQLRQLESMRRDFVANVSHELKTPITSIKGFTETLLDGALEDSEAAPRFLEIIARQSDRLNAIIEDLLSLARIERLEEARESIQFQKYPAQKLLDDIVLTTQNLAERRNSTISVHCDDELEITLEPLLFEQALINLVNNALKYSPEKSTIELRVKESGSMIYFDVVDLGPGIPGEHVPRLFERFYRVDASRSREVGGTGLGLAIVKHIAQLHRGDITVESVVSQGSTFTISIPNDLEVTIA